VVTPGARCAGPSAWYDRPTRRAGAQRGPNVRERVADDGGSQAAFRGPSWSSSFEVSRTPVLATAGQSSEEVAVERGVSAVGAMNTPAGTDGR
jgi:hypothetical protein